MIYGNKFYRLESISGELVVENELDNINKILESFDIVNENAADVFKKIVEKAKEVLAKILNLISKVFKKFIPKLYEALQKLVSKLRGSDKIKLNENKIIVYYTWTDTYHKYIDYIEKYCDMMDKHYSIICNVYTYSDASKELKEAEESKKKLDNINKEIISLVDTEKSSDFEDKMITKTELKIEAGADSTEILHSIAKIDTLLFDVKRSITNVNEFYKWVKKVKDDVDELVKLESSKAFNNAMVNNKTLVIGDESYGDSKLLQAIGMQEVTKTTIKHFSNLTHILNLYLKNNLQAYKSICGLLKDPDTYKEYINFSYLSDAEINK